MRFLDRAWVDGERTDFEMQLHEQVYLRHLAAISDDLPRRLRVFAQVTAGTGLHKARLIKARLNRAKGTLRVVFQLPTAHEIWAKVRMQFSKVDIEAFDARPWKRVCSNPESTCLVDEVDLAPDGLFEHRMLFDPDGETSVIFKRFVMEIEELPDLHLEPHGGWREDK